jgi:hypothetical protein
MKRNRNPNLPCFQDAKGGAVTGRDGGNRIWRPVPTPPAPGHVPHQVDGMRPVSPGVAVAMW